MLKMKEITSRKMAWIIVLFLLLAGSALTFFPQNQKDSSPDYADVWMLSPFVKQKQFYPILQAEVNAEFSCPVTHKKVKWQESYLFNPAAVVKDDKVYLVFRAEDKIGRFGGTSRLGLAVSSDGVSFTKSPAPVLFPDNDNNLEYEREGGCEDPRIVETDEDTFIMTYTAFNGQLARLCIASSPDLLKWQKHGLAFGKAQNGSYRDLWSKSGAIVCRLNKGHLIAARINGKYWMYWGESEIFLATSENLIDWEPVERTEFLTKRFASYEGNGQYKTILENPRKAFRTALTTRNSRFDNGLVEPGPPAILTSKGILFLYNAMSYQGDPSLPDGAYTVAQAMFDRKDPSVVIHRAENFFLKAMGPDETAGQLANTAFSEALVFFKGQWLLYYTMSEAKIGVAICKKNLF
jgi:predicted GH43/DUF377 family glycosyl hydrolase